MVHSDKVETRSITNITLPTINNGLVIFSDTTEFLEFYSQVADLDQEDLDELFDGTGFVSVAYLLDTDEFDEPKNMYNPFLSDPVMRAICNPYFEFQVGDALITYINNTQILLSDINDEIARNEIRQMTKGQNISPNDIPENTFWGEDTTLSLFSISPCKCDISIEQVDCNTVRVWGKCIDLLWRSGNGVLQIFSGTSFPSTISPQPSFTYNINGNFEYFLPLNNNNTHFQARISPNCKLASSKQVAAEYSPSGPSCDFNDRNIDWTLESQADEGFKYRVEAYKNFWSSYEKAHIQSFKYDYSDSKWKVSKAQKLIVTIEADRRNFSCIVFDHNEETKSCTNCKKKTASVNAGIFGKKNFVHHCTGDVTGIFKKVTNNDDIDKTYDLEFDCCL